MISNEDLLAAGDYRALWHRTLPLVKWQLGRMVKSGALQSHYLTDDIIQECSLAVGKAIPRWNPQIGSLSNFMVQCIRSRALDHIRRESSGIVGGRDAQGHAGPLDESTMSSGELPALDKLMSRERTATVQSALAALCIEDYDMLVQYYGLDHHRRPRSLREIAAQYDETPGRVKDRLMQAVASMRTMLSDTDSEDSHEQTRYSGL